MSIVPRPRIAPPKAGLSECRATRCSAAMCADRSDEDSIQPVAPVEVVPEFGEAAVAALRPEPACSRLELSAKTRRRTADSR